MWSARCLTLLALAACAADVPAPAPAPAPEEPAPAPAPAPKAAAEFEVAPVSIQWNAEKKAIAIEAKLVGDALADRKEPVYVGVTVITDTDAEVDLLVHTLFPGNLEESLLFSAEIPHNPKHVLIGAWNTKVEPCEVDRPGCKEFGFVLDNSIASFPLGLYTEGMRQRFVPAEYEIGVKGPLEPVTKAAGEFATIFGSSVKTSAVESTQKKGVWVGQKDDLGMAAAVAADLGLEYGVAEGLATPMVVVSQ